MNIEELKNNLIEDFENITSYKEIEFLKEHINNKYIKQSELWNIKKAV